ncbi:hypothetical protein FKP32DRAFT_885495 [Trametes sanguinea]|nr:hypothetical protein FKP32DRAFT_885495 [Trametes sanguinea]
MQWVCCGLRLTEERWRGGLEKMAPRGARKMMQYQKFPPCSRQSRSLSGECLAMRLQATTLISRILVASVKNGHCAGLPNFPSVPPRSRATVPDTAPLWWLDSRAPSTVDALKMPRQSLRSSAVVSCMRDNLSECMINHLLHSNVFGPRTTARVRGGPWVYIAAPGLARKFVQEAYCEIP